MDQDILDFVKEAGKKHLSPKDDGGFSHALNKAILAEFSSMSPEEKLAWFIQRPHCLEWAIRLLSKDITHSVINSNELVFLEAQYAEMQCKKNEGRTIYTK